MVATLKRQTRIKHKYAERTAVAAKGRKAVADIQTPNEPETASPRWGPTIKLIIGLTFVLIAVALVIYLRSFVGPLMLAFILSFLLQPLTNWVSRVTHLSWSGSVNLIFIVLILFLLGSLTGLSVAIVQQVGLLVTFVRDFVQKDLPGIISDLSTSTFTILTFEIDMRNFDIGAIGERLLQYLQPIVSNVGGIFSTFASGAASTTGWALFVLVISYFILSGANRVSQGLINVEIPGYGYDLRRLGRELSRIWNTFLRGQLIMFILVIISYTILLTILGTRYSLAIAVLAGLARFVPYLGPTVVWITLGLVSLFQGGNYFGLEPWQYMILTIVCGFLLDQVYDNLVAPRFFGDTLGVHPAAVLLAALVAANLIGLIGLLLATPVLATITLFARYALRKLFDLDPWPLSEEEEIKSRHKPVPRSIRRLQGWYAIARKKLNRQ